MTVSGQIGSNGLRATALSRNLWTITCLGSRLRSLLTGAEFDTAPRKCRKKMRFFGREARFRALKGRFRRFAARNQTGSVRVLQPNVSAETSFQSSKNARLLPHWCSTQRLDA